MDVETFKKTLSDIGERFIYATVRGLYTYLQPIVTQYLVCNKSEIWP